MGDFEDKVKKIEASQSSGGLSGWWKSMSDNAEADHQERVAKIEQGNIQHQKLSSLLKRLSPAIQTANNSPHGLWGHLQIVSAHIERKTPEETPLLILPHQSHRRDLRTVVGTTPDSEDKYFLGDQQWFTGSGGQSVGDTEIARGWSNPRMNHQDFTADEIVEAAHSSLAHEYVHQKGRTPWRVAAAATALAVALGLMKSCDASAQTVDHEENYAEHPVLVEPSTLDR